MSSCRSCGHQLGVGRFCVNCGAAVDSSTPDGTPVSTPVTEGDWRTDTAERKLPRPRDPRTPPSAVAPPPPPRYPLYADEVEGYTPYGPLTAGTESTSTSVVTPGPADVAPAYGYPEDHDQDHDQDYDQAYDQYGEERRSPVLWILAAALALVLVAAGWWFLVRDSGSGGGSDDTAHRAARSPGADGNPGVELAGRARAKAPRTAPPNQDVDGKQVSYDASNMLDGVPDTAWRVAGDATGLELTFTLHERAELHEVGLINGYAKTSTDHGRTFDWYLGNRRVRAVVWEFDDGSKVRQQLEDDRKLQVVDVKDVTTKRVVLRLVAVTKPGTGHAARDFTAISEVSLVGVPTG